jgi:hypothetical protein
MEEGREIHRGFGKEGFRMKGKYPGTMTVDQMYQALYEDYKKIFRHHGVTHVKGVHLYFTPCNEHGEEVFITDDAGKRIHSYESAGYYRSAACAYEANPFEPKIITRPNFNA